MKLEYEASDYSCDSQSSQDSSTTDYVSPPTSRPALSLVPYHQYGDQDEDSLMFATMFDFQPDDKKMLASLEGLNSGVPTRTTATLTPTHLRNIEQTFIELQCRAEHERLAAPHAGFVPPPVAAQPEHYGILSQPAYGGAGGAGALHVSPGPGSSGDSSSSSLPPAPKRRNMGGRRPTKAPLDISPEEEERRTVRRERNKMAAARCRKRRLDHTNELVGETEELERKKQSLQDEIRELNNSCQQLQYILDGHRVGCRLGGGAARAPTPPDVKPYPLPIVEDVYVKVEAEAEDGVHMDNDIFTSPQAHKRVMLSAANPQVVTSCSLDTIASDTLDTPPATRPSRPCFLQVPFSITPAQLHGLKNGDISSVAGVDISTPSSLLPFNFDSLMDGGTGLTPVQACATQQTRSHPEVLSPETASSNKLVML